MGPKGLQHGRGDPHGAQVESYVLNGGFWQGHVPPEARFFKPWNRAYQDWAVAMGFYDSPQPYLFQLWSEPLRRFQLACEGEGARQPPDALRARVHAAMDPAPRLVGALRRRRGREGLPPPRPDPAPHGPLPRLGLAERLAAPDPRPQSALCSARGLGGAGVPRGGLGAGHVPARGDRRASGADGCAEPPYRVDLECHRQAQGAWALDRRRRRRRRGSCSTISSRSSCRPGGTGIAGRTRTPVTGQAAWFDLRVRVERCEAPSEAQPAHPPVGCPVEAGPESLAWTVGR
jgi:hypothetical protein